MPFVLQHSNEALNTIGKVHNENIALRNIEIFDSIKEFTKKT